MSVEYKAKSVEDYLCFRDVQAAAHRDYDSGSIGLDDRVATPAGDEPVWAVLKAHIIPPMDVIEEALRKTHEPTVVDPHLDINNAPKDRRFLCLTKTVGWSYRLQDYEVTGEKWVEAWWDANYLSGGEPKFREWAGRERTVLVGSSLRPIRWAELPK